MTFQLSPSTVVTETDLTSIIPAVSSSNAAMAGDFLWGPVGQITSIDNENEMVSIFGKPADTCYIDNMCATSFLAYASALQVVRTATTGRLNSVDYTGAGNTTVVDNGTTYQSLDFTGTGILWIAKNPGAYGDNIGVAFADRTTFNATDSAGNPTWYWTDSLGVHHVWTSLFQSAPTALNTPAAGDLAEFHIVVFDATGVITGTEGTVLETYAFVTSSSTAKYYDGTSAYFKTRVNNMSSYVWVGDAALLTGGNNGATLASGADGTLPSTDGERETALDLFLNPTTTDIGLLMQTGGSSNVGQYIIQDIAEVRRDCVAFVSPAQTDVVDIFNDTTVITNIKATRTFFGDSSYAVMDSAYKLMYDRYNDVNRWIPLNADIAGLCAQIDALAEPWFSPAGLDVGQIKNLIALSNTESLDDRNALYQVGVNPVVIFPTVGPVLFGDKTMQSKPSAFDRINVRRLFITLEKAISTAANYKLFKLNTAQTRANFVQELDPFLRQVKALQGITDYKVVCDSSNNPGSVIDANQFVADIYIKPTRSINFIKLNFVAVSTGVDFSEVVQSAAA